MHVPGGVSREVKPPLAAAPASAAAPEAGAPRLSRLAYASTLVGAAATGVSFTADMLVPSAGLLGVGLGLAALRRIRSAGGRVWGNTFGHVGVAVGVLHLFLFAFLFGEGRGYGVQRVA